MSGDTAYPVIQVILWSKMSIDNNQVFKFFIKHPRGLPLLGPTCTRKDMRPKLFSEKRYLVIRIQRSSSVNKV